MQQKEDTKNSLSEKKPEAAPRLSETISNAHSSGDGSIRLSEDGLIEPPGETIADAEANKELETKQEDY